MTKTFCDRCEKEIDTLHARQNVILESSVSALDVSGRNEFVLCQECKSDLMDWFEKGKK